jgi:hypothetical protein
MSESMPRTFSRAVVSQWRQAVTGEHSALYWLAGLILAILVPVFAWDQASNVWLKALLAAGIPIVLLITSMISAMKNAWTIERTERHRLAEQLSPKITVSLDGDIEGNGVTTLPYESGEQTKWVQVLVQSATNAPLVNCEAYITHIKRLG